MSDLVVVVYQSEAKAEEMRRKLFELQKEYLIEIGDAAIAVKQEDGHVKLKLAFQHHGCRRHMGGLWGSMIGLVFLNPILGVALGAASGAISGALTDYGVNDEFMKKLSESLQPGKVALFVLVRKVTGDKMLEALKGTGGTVLKTSLDDSKGRRSATPSPLADDPPRSCLNSFEFRGSRLEAIDRGPNACSTQARKLSPLIGPSSTKGGRLVASRSGEEGPGFPMPVWRLGDQRRAAFVPSVHVRHVGLGAPDKQGNREKAVAAARANLGAHCLCQRTNSGPCRARRGGETRCAFPDLGGVGDGGAFVGRLLRRVTP